MSSEHGQIISQVVPESLASELDIRPGDRLISIDGEPVLDVFDYQVRQLSEELLLLIEKADGSRIEFELEKDEDEDLGMVFDKPLLDDCTSCHNRCIFCFIDQLPPGMRKTLYFKDDDMRMSFLHGNYVTLTNIDDDELDRLISYRFSPMNISVHATDPMVRMKMMRNRHAGELYQRLQKLAAEGIEINCQLVMCPGINDGEVLEKTLADLEALGEAVLSIAMVPVGVTRYREEKNLFPVSVFSCEQASDVIDTVNRWQKRFIDKQDRRIVYAGDEFYLRAKRDFPPSEEYEEYPQLENGVGMAALFISTINQYLTGMLPDMTETGFRRSTPSAAINRSKSVTDAKAEIIIATGEAAAEIFGPMLPSFAEKFKLKMRLIKIENDFFGHSVTVAGLITGQDLLHQLENEINNDDSNSCEQIILISDCMLKADEDIFLDDISLQELADSLGREILAVPEAAEGLLTVLMLLSSQMNNDK